MATLSQMMNPQMLQQMQQMRSSIMQGGAPTAGPSPFRSQMPADMAAGLQRNHQFQMDPNATAGFAPASAAMQQAMRGALPQARPATPEQFMTRSAQPQRGNPQGWAAGMQQAMQRQGGGANGTVNTSGGQLSFNDPYGRGVSPQAQQLQQMAQRFGQPATTPQFDPRAYMAQQQAAQQQRWQQMMQQLAANPPAPGMTPQSWTTPRTWGNTNAGVAGTPAGTTPTTPMRLYNDPGYLG